MLTYFLNQYYDKADKAQQQAFSNLLSLSDPELYDTLTGVLQCVDEVTATVIQTIREYDRN